MTAKIIIVAPGAEDITSKHFEPDWADRSLRLIEEAGRTSHKSEGAITETSAPVFVPKIALGLGHESITEHSVFTVRITCSRAASHQLVRHRLGAYTQESQRYCDYSHPKHGQCLQVICPPSIGDPPVGTIISRYPDGEGITWVDDRGWAPGLLIEFCTWAEGVLTAYEAYLNLRSRGVKGEDARFLLPNACKTEVVTTFNYRMWRHVIIERGLNPHAQWEIKGIFQKILGMLADECPALFFDLLAGPPVTFTAPQMDVIKTMLRMIMEDLEGEPAVEADFNKALEDHCVGGAKANEVRKLFGL